MEIGDVFLTVMVQKVGSEKAFEITWSLDRDEIKKQGLSTVIHHTLKRALGGSRLLVPKQEEW